jgi:nickel transport protein
MKALIVLVVALLMAAPAQAHKLKVFAAAEGTEISGYAYFSGGARAMEVAGQVLAPDGTLVTSLRTNDRGEFRFQATKRMDYVIAIDAGDGHAARTTVLAGDLPKVLPAGPSESVAPMVEPTAIPETSAIEAAVARQIRPLREQLDAYEDKLRLHDILGGIGTIFGLFGTFAWLAARKRSP